MMKRLWEYEGMSLSIVSTARNSAEKTEKNGGRQ